MLRDLDRLMADAGLDALVVVGPAEANADLFYLTRGASVSGGPVVKKRGEKPVLLYSPMELEGARASGCEIVSVKDLDLDTITREAPTRYEASLGCLARVVERFGLSGRVQFLGRSDPSTWFHLVRDLVARFPALEPVAPTNESLLVVARMTKDEDEVERIRETGRIASRIMGEVLDWLRSARLEAGALADAKGPLTVARVKARLRTLLAEVGMTDHGHTIFALGADGALPHSRGTDADVLAPGVPVVFDFFPQPVGGGYFFDMTRSFCLREATDEYLEHWDLVKKAFDASVARIALGALTNVPHEAACDVFEAAGHPTNRSDPKSNVGYFHSLGHGLGLDIHEAPLLGLAKSMRHPFVPGLAFTVEPGLYYPEKGFGIRLEDTMRLDADGRLENLTEFPIEPVV